MLISELRMLVQNLKTGIEQDASFFSGVLGYARHLASLPFDNFGPEQLSEARIAVGQLGQFFDRWADSGEGFYLEPPQTRDLRPTLVRIEEVVRALEDLDPAELGGEAIASDQDRRPVQETSELVRRIFVVHGHDSGPREAIARVLESLDFEAVILESQPNQGRTVIEKFVAYSDASFAVVVMTPDDVGAIASLVTELEGEALRQSLQPRARQNVILELGFFVGRLGRDRVVALVVDDVEIPSDVQGVIYIRFDGAGAWKLRLGAELRAAGFNVDLNNLQ